MRIGSLFSGYGGLELGAQAVIGGDVAWHSEIEPGPAKILAHHHPEVPNLGDITKVDWSQVEPVDVITGGFPCQDVSAAGKRAGLKDGTRSGLWSYMRDAIDTLRPSLVVAENVRGLLSAEAHSPVEPCPYCVGDGSGPNLRALGAVVGDLSDIGYVGRWVGLRAADVGAPHGRFRVFVAAWPAADTSGVRRGTGGSAGPGEEGGRWALDHVAGRGVDTPAHPHDTGLEGHGRLHPAPREGEADAHHRGPAPDPEGIGRGEGRAESAGLERGSDPSERGHAAPTSTNGDPVREQPVTERRSGGSSIAGLDREAPADSVRDGREGREERDLGTAGGLTAPFGTDTAGRVLAWGPYEPAIRRWELTLGRPAPAPTQKGKRGGQQLSPAFVEFLMGLPQGWVTEVPGLSRNEQLKALGNGVVWQQAAAALSWLLSESSVAA